ncbi:MULTISPECIES: Light dependent period protein LdpA domain-containing protein [Prochlorococcus]|uniref:Light dependent period protein LdpA domain-containing protein n=1 Tax=Prochlorococcus TaxID=1218 RepID=UPI001CEC759F|nr:MULTISPECIES: LdpA C-terminal domain-containing domain [Prochlorococcus]
MNESHYSNEISLRRGTWVKLICGASNDDLTSISDLCSVYAAAGVNCIDIAADIAVVAAAREGITWAKDNLGIKPWLMISLSDGKDIHFRKAYFNPKVCPKECSRPCEKVCPTNAINPTLGIIQDLCYGCGRCIPACPLELIQEKDNLLRIQDFGNLISKAKPDAIEIHTAPGRIKAFEQSVKEVVKSKVQLKRVAVSCGLEGHGITKDQLSQELWSRHECLCRYNQKPIWQLDGRPMSGDIGRGTAKAAILLLEKMHSIAPPGPIQLAGGTNEQTILHLQKNHRLAGIAFGGMARKLIQPFLIEAKAQNKKLIDWPEGWDKALKLAKGLIKPWLNNEYRMHY